MGKLDILVNKKLVLKNVMIEKHSNISFAEIDKKMMEFENKLCLLNVQVFGPLITKMSGTQIRETGELSVNYDFMVQAHDYVQYKNQFETQESLVVSNCMYVRFDDEVQYLKFAISKLDLHMYENDIDESGVLYTVMMENDGNYVKVDYFKPML